MRGTWLWGVVCVCGVVSACGAEAPPYEDLRLRDALGADPAVVTALPADAREQLLHRMLTTRSAQTQSEKVPNEKGRSPSAEVNEVDGARAERDEDSLLVWKARVDDGNIVAEPHPDPRAGDTGGLDPLPELPAVEGTPPEGTAREESRALAGEGGRTVRELMKVTGAKHVARVVGWPAAAAAIDDTVYVNASWLVLLAMNEPEDAGTSTLTANGVSFNVRPSGLRGNPYRLYATLGECRDDVTSRCQACLDHGACDDDAALEDFADGREECGYLLAPRGDIDAGPDAAPISRVDELCAMALLSVSTVAECVRDERCLVPTGSRKSTSLPAADAFLQDDRCVRALNLCLSGSDEGGDAGPRPLSLGDVKVSGCSDPVAACSSSCKGCDKACSSGKCSGGSGPSCTSCKNCSSCSGCDSNTRSGDSSGYGSGGSGNPAPVPTGTTGGGGGSSGGGSGGGGSGGGTGGGGTGGGGSSSSSGGGGCGKSSSSGTSESGSNCSSCKSCSSSSSSSSGSSGGSSSSSCGTCKSGNSSNCKCETAPDPAPLAPFSSFFWLALPLVYLGKNARVRREGSRA
ncbi:hypothetical protein LVJ94_12840 [Pendulispora rubella]|uniref:Uncharacterized protein n=1 Tax=Pendulispora rubella TaxID=2741070 RepID=A0ABZ2LEA0_9BACT